MENGLLFILSGPSGSGKSCIAKKLALQPSIHLAVSATTRLPREGETDGKEYYFISEIEFQNRIQKGEMLEYNRYCDHYYGTPMSEMRQEIAKGKDVILEIDVNGAKQVQKKMHPITIFVLPPSMDVLKERLLGRGSEEEEVMKRRIQEAAREIKEALYYDYLIINSDLDQAVEEIAGIMSAEKHKTIYMKSYLEEVWKNG